MDKPFLVLEAVNADKCPVFEAGMRIALHGRRVVGPEGAPLCAYMASQLRAFILLYERSKDPRKAIAPLLNDNFLCADHDCGGVFRLIFAETMPPAVEDAKTPAEPDALAESIGEESMPPTPAGESDSARNLSADASEDAALLDAETVEELSDDEVELLPEEEIPLPVEAEEAPRGPRASRISPRSTNFVYREDLPFLKQLPAPAAEALLAAGETVTVPENTVVIEQGTEGQCLYVVRSGRVVVGKEMPNETAVDLATLGPDEIFGEMSLLSGEPCNASVRTLDEAVLQRIPPGELDDLMTHDPLLHKYFGRVFTERLKATNVRLEEELVRGMSGRLSMISLLEILQTLIMSHLTGTFQVSHEDGGGVLEIRDGQVTAARAGTLEGEAAFKEIARWRDGVFRFRENRRTDQAANITTDTVHLLMEAARELDEAAQSPGGE